MFKKVHILIFTLLFTQFSYSQSDTIVELQHLFTDLSDSLRYELSYVPDKETINLEIKENEVIVCRFKMLVKDIHPEGIFLLPNERQLTIRILSIDNGYKFIQEKFRNGYRLSKTTNVIDVITNQEESNAMLFISQLKAFLNPSNHKDDSDIQVVEPPRKKNK